MNSIQSPSNSKMPPRRANTRNQPAAPADPLNEQSMNAEFRAAYQVLAQAMITQFVERQGITKDLCQLASLGVRLLESPDEGVIVQNAAESSLVVEVKEK
ncbi:hypothetical protein MTR67_001900 [Solanum verrucosum]|uniref:Uncharacterized protein n=1 Tax=Solanum verrucosum TaxID=315347 RepID=A0AAF0TCT6_SOLVR|nr:hypothetical protein MTR67_001900 [Solanum verrucosum]